MLNNFLQQNYGISEEEYTFWQKNLSPSEVRRLLREHKIEVERVPVLCVICEKNEPIEPGFVCGPCSSYYLKEEYYVFLENNGCKVGSNFPEKFVSGFEEDDEFKEEWIDPIDYDDDYDEEEEWDEEDEDLDEFEKNWNGDRYWKDDE